MQLRILTIALFTGLFCQAQYSFSGFINPEERKNTVYLSVVEDYRKLSGIYYEQLIAKTLADTTGYFEFKGNLLDSDNRIYRIHANKCIDVQHHKNRFSEYCQDSEALLFIAKNTDTLKLPFSSENEVFCNIESNNPKANAFLKIDSLKNEMRFAYHDVRTEANRRLNNKKWFKVLQDYGASLDDPLAELSIYAFLSDRSHDFYSYYIKDLQNNVYYNDLKRRLKKTYPNTPYALQYSDELAADRYMLTLNNDSKSYSKAFLIVLLMLSLVLNAALLYCFWKREQSKSKDLKAKLSKQEQVVLEHLLQDKSNKAIAQALFVSVSTVKSHTNAIYKKLNVQSRNDVKSMFIK